MLTEESEQVLASIHITQRLPSVLTMTRLDLLMHFVKLLSLKSIEQDATERLVEVLLDARDDLFQNVGVG